MEVWVVFLFVSVPTFESSAHNSSHFYLSSIAFHSF